MTEIDRFLGITVKRMAPCRRLDGHVKEPYEMSMAWEPDRRFYFFSSPPTHLCVVTYIIEIPLNVTLNNQSTPHTPIRLDKLYFIFYVFGYFKKSLHYYVSLHYSHTFLQNFHLTFGLIAVELYDHFRTEWDFVL